MEIDRARNALPLNSQKLEALLKWLDPACDVAGKRYGTIQAGLVGIFASKGFCDAVGLAEEVIDRVAERLPQIGLTYDGDPANYFRGRGQECKSRGRTMKRDCDRYPS